MLNSLFNLDLLLFKWKKSIILKYLFFHFQTLSGIFKKCLNMAEDTRLTSISFPAIGTGNLGFPKTLVSSLMLAKILKFSKEKHRKHLKKVMIIIYSGDVESIQVRKK